MKVPVSPPKYHDVFGKLVRTPEGMKRFQAIMMGGIGPTPDGKYRHWDILRHLTPPDGLTSEEWWFGIKAARTASYQPLPFLDKQQVPFKYALVEVMLRFLHQVDKDASGAIKGTDLITSPNLRDTYIFNSLVEEAITSSQLEGASTTRDVAKEMIRTGRKPRDRSEQMIHNNYQAMTFIRRFLDQQLTSSVVLELHRILTDNTLDEPAAAGRFRTHEESIRVVDQFGTVLHQPPESSTLQKRMAAMCVFANVDDPKRFIHPVVRAIALHFWLAYDHPFVDGNGRTARALFYWAMAREGYWLCEFLSISRILKKAPSKYNRAFLYTETDDNDLTYFILNQLDVLQRAIAELHSYLQRKSAEVLEVENLLRRSRLMNSVLNHRQLALLNHAMKNPFFRYTIQSHRRSHNISYQTSRTDLLGLVKHKVLDHTRSGRTFSFIAPPDLQSRLKGLSSSSR